MDRHGVSKPARYRTEDKLLADGEASTGNIAP
jgi:hypothetical protein